MNQVKDIQFQIDQKKCIRCGECVNECPVNILVIGDSVPFIADGRNGDCIGCQHCLAVCPEGAVSVRCWGFGLKIHISSIPPRWLRICRSIDYQRYSPNIIVDVICPGFIHYQTKSGTLAAAPHDGNPDGRVFTALTVEQLFQFD